MVELKTPGLTVKWTKVGSWLYATIYHQSGLQVVSIREPISGGMRKFAAEVDEMMKGVDWTKSALDLAKSDLAKKLAMDLASKYNRASYGV